MRILISGGTGLAGSYLIPFLLKEGHELTVLTTQKSPKQLTGRETYCFWNPAADILDPEIFSRHDAIINMAGANIGERWTSSHKQMILQSRLKATKLLAEGAAGPGSVVRSFISFSATGIYGSDEVHKTEEGQLGPDDDFLTQVCRQWEAATASVDGKMQKVILRLGILFSPRGGMLGKLLPLFKLGLGASIGSGKQYISWIHPNDLCRIIKLFLDNPEISGVVNATAPHPVTMKRLSGILAGQLHRPLWLPSVTKWQLRLIGGEGALEALKSFNITSKVLEERKFTFEFEHPEDAILQLLGRKY